MKEIPKPTCAISLIVSAAAKNPTAHSSWATVPPSPAKWLSPRCARDGRSNGMQKKRTSFEALPKSSAEEPCPYRSDLLTTKAPSLAPKLGQFGAGRETAALARLSGMQIKPFRIEQFFGKYEFTTKYLLSSSDMQSCTIQELLELEPGSHEKLLQHWCGYTESAGAPELREVVSGMYRGIKPNDVLVMGATEEGIFVLYHALLSPGDHVVVETPCYESALEVARSTGAEISEWRRRFEDGWAHDLSALEKLLKPNTKIIYINTPHNPTGLLMQHGIFEKLIALASSRGIIVFCDEVYRELEHDPASRLPAACEVYERAVSLGSMSKTYDLPGLRLGWLTTRDADILNRCLELKYYTSICSNAPSEFLAALTLRHRKALIKRNREIVLRNLPHLDAFIR